MRQTPTLLETALQHDRRVLLFVLVAIPLASWTWIGLMARDMYGTMGGASAWMMTSVWDWPHMLLLWVMWAVMMTAMMLPTAAPLILLYAAAARRNAESGSPARRVYALAAGYVLTWALFSVLATALQRILASALVIRPYLSKMTRSELLTVLTTGMATVASSTLGIYVAFLSGVFPQIAGHLLSASVLAIPAAVVMTKLLVPETEIPETLSGVPPEDEATRSRNLMSAIIEGAMDGLKLAAGISALLIAVLGLVALGDKMLGLGSSWLGMAQPLSFVRILSWVFYPVAFLLGLKPEDIPEAARLLGERVILTEVVSYQDLSRLISDGKMMDGRSVVILSYALCGFAHVASVAIFVGGTAALVPSRRDDLAALGWRALLAATLATLMTGCVAGMFSTGSP